MLDSGPKEKGIVLFIVLGTILLVIVLANAILSMISSQSRLTHHQVSRIQAYYAAQAGMNLAIEKLRIGDWQPNSSGGADKYACINGCDVTPTYPVFADSTIRFNVKITIHPLNSGINGTTKLDIKTTYTPS